MIKSDTTSGHIKVCSNAYHEALTLYNECKVNNKSPFILEINKKSAVIEGAKFEDRIEKGTLENTGLLCKYIAYHEVSIQDLLNIPDHKIINRQIRRQYESLHESDAKIISGYLYPNDMVDDMTADQARIEARNVCKRMGISNGYLYCMERGANGKLHIHFTGNKTQHLKSTSAIKRITGWGYVVAKDLRKDYLYLSEEDPNYIQGFWSTANYSMSKYEAYKYHKRPYLKV